MHVLSQWNHPNKTERWAKNDLLLSVPSDARDELDVKSTEVLETASAFECARGQIKMASLLWRRSEVIKKTWGRIIDRHGRLSVSTLLVISIVSERVIKYELLGKARGKKLHATIDLSLKQKVLLFALYRFIIGSARGASNLLSARQQRWEIVHRSCACPILQHRVVLVYFCTRESWHFTSITPHLMAEKSMFSESHLAFAPSDQRTSWAKSSRCKRH